MHKAVEPQIIDVSLSPFLSLKINLKNLDVKKKKQDLTILGTLDPKGRKTRGVLPSGSVRVLRGAGHR